MKVMHLTWGETPRSYGVFGSQVVQQFVETRKLFDECEFNFVCAVPLVHSGFVREKNEYKNELKKIKIKLGDINYHQLNIYFPQNFVNSSKLTFAFMHYGVQKNLLNLVSKLDPDIIHCRSYHATYAAIKLKEKYALKYKVIFDTRGPWPEAVAYKKKYADNDLNYAYLKDIEKYLLLNADKIISVSDTNTNQYNKIIGDTRTETIYLSSNYGAFKSLHHKRKKDYLTAVYVGALSEADWHTPSMLRKLFDAIVARTMSEVKLLIITSSNHKSIIKEFGNRNVLLKQTRTAEELSNLLTECDFGLLPGAEIYTDIEKYLYESILGTKTVEYFSEGLPVICNQFCGGAAMIIRNYKMGLTYDPNSMQEINSVEIDKMLSIDIRSRYENTLKKLFSYESNANKYSLIYNKL